MRKAMHWLMGILMVILGFVLRVAPAVAPR
jgi:hypothetical protein